MVQRCQEWHYSVMACYDQIYEMMVGSHCLISMQEVTGQKAREEEYVLK